MYLPSKFYIINLKIDSDFRATSTRGVGDRRVDSASVTRRTLTCLRFISRNCFLHEAAEFAKSGFFETSSQCDQMLE